MRILGLDPGVNTGFAVIDATTDTLRAVSYGVIPVVHGGPTGLVKSIREWLDWAAATYELRGSGCDITYEEMVLTSQPSWKEAQEVRGVIRAWCELNKPVDSFAYTPEQVRDQLGIPQTRGVKEMVKRIVSKALGYVPTGPDHGWDALAVAIAHAIRINAWHARLRPIVPSQGRAAKVKSIAGALPARMTAAEFREMIKTGRV